MNINHLRQMLSQSGTVLVTVMLMVAVAALIATDIAYRQQMDILRTGAFLSRDAASQYLWAAEELGVAALKQDREDDDKNARTNPNDPIADDLGEEWNKGALFPLPDGIGTIEGRLKDLQGRFNINSLMHPDPNYQAKYADTLLNILNRLLADHPAAFPTGTTATMLKERIIDWIDPDQNTNGFDGMEDDDYFRKEEPYRTANHFIAEASELLLIDGFTPQAIALLEDQIAFLPADTKINLYTADKQLLLDMGFNVQQVNDFVDNQRPNAYKEEFKVRYSDVNEVFSFLMGQVAGSPGATPQNPQATLPGSPGGVTGTSGGTPANTSLQVDMFDIQSHFFLLKGKAVVNDKPVLVESVIWKPELSNTGAGAGSNTTQPDIPVTTIMRKFVDPLKQTN